MVYLKIGCSPKICAAAADDLARTAEVAAIHLEDDSALEAAEIRHLEMIRQDVKVVTPETPPHGPDMLPSLHQQTRRLRKRMTPVIRDGSTLP